MSWRCGLSRKSATYTHLLWITYQQFQSIDAQVRKGEKATLIIFEKEYDVEPDPAEQDDDVRTMSSRVAHPFPVSRRIARRMTSVGVRRRCETTLRSTPICSPSMGRKSSRAIRIIMP